MQIKCETLLLIYTAFNQTVACRVKCQSFSTNDNGRNITWRNLTNEQWQLFDNCIEKSLKAHKRRKISKMNCTYNLANIDVTIKESPLNYRQLKDFIYDYDDLIHSNIKHIWDCCIVTKQNYNLSPECIDDKNVPEYEPLAVHSYGNDMTDVVTYKPSKPAVDIDEDIDLRNYILKDTVPNDDDGDDDDAYQPMSLDSTNSLTESISPQYKPSPIKSKTNKSNNNAEIILTLDCNETIDATTPPQLPLNSLRVKLKDIKSKSMDELKCFEETEYIPSGSGQQISDNSKIVNVPQYIPSPISCTNSTKQSTLTSLASLPVSTTTTASKIITKINDETKDELKKSVYKNGESRNVIKMKTHKNRRKINAIKNWNIDDGNVNIVSLRRSARPQCLIEKLVTNNKSVKTDKIDKCDKNVKGKSIKLSAKHKELFGSDDDDDTDTDADADNKESYSPAINNNIKNSATTTTTSCGITKKQKSNAKNCSKSSTTEKAKCETVTNNNDDGDISSKQIIDVDDKQMPNFRKYLPTREEIDNMDRINNLRREQALKWKERLDQMQSREIKVTQYLTLKDMTLEEIMMTFDKYKPYLDEIYTKCHKKNHIKSFNGLNHCFVFNLIEEKLQTQMLQKLCEIYCRHSNTTHPTMLGNAILPEWLMRIFMHKHQLSRQEAMEQIKAQENNRLNADENDSLFNFDL